MGESSEACRAIADEGDKQEDAILSVTGRESGSYLRTSGFDLWEGEGFGILSDFVVLDTREAKKAIVSMKQAISCLHTEKQLSARVKFLSKISGDTSSLFRTELHITRTAGTPNVQTATLKPTEWFHELLSAVRAGETDGLVE